MSGVDLLALIGRDTLLRRTCSQNGGEYSGPCPLCRTGHDRFKVWPHTAHGEGRWACLGRTAGRSGCDKGGDAIQYLRERDGLSFEEARARLALPPAPRENRRGTRSGGMHPAIATITPSAGPCALPPSPLGRSPSPFVPPPSSFGPSPSSFGPSPSSFGPLPSPFGPPAPPFKPPASPAPASDSPAPPAPWQSRAAYHAARCAAHLWGDEGAKPRAYLHTRGLFDGILRSFQIGYNPEDVYEDRTHWGLPENGHKIWLPRGITFPWRIGGPNDGGIWRLNIRRPLTPSQIAAGETKYIGPAGYGTGLYNAGALTYDRPAVLVEGEIDALTIAQACGTQIAAVATGSTAGARRPVWIARLAQASVVLLAFDVDEAGPNGAPGAGDQAAAWWQARLPRARRLRPLDHDVNTLPDIETVRAWLTRALAQDP